MEKIDCTCFNLRRAARTAGRYYDAALGPVGLRNTQFSALAVLTQMGPTPVSRLAEVMAMERTTLTRNLKPLERDGLVEQSVGEDRRQRIVKLTRSGRAMYAKALALWQTANDSAGEALGQTRTKRMLADLKVATAKLS
ncbi:MAG: MarR family winged helix-turn-helix transcriptional regulator [Planctomycetota bacterium]|nr:MarR family winged helix-turn-helix transcriptional regulator [Planctomycetota bacterium]